MVGWLGGWGGGGGWVAGLSETKTKPNPKLKLELKFGAELCNFTLALKHLIILCGERPSPDG